MMRSALAALHRGDVLILDDALGAGAAAHVLSETKHLLRTNRLLAETPRSFLPNVPEAFATSIYDLFPSFWDSLRLTNWFSGADEEQPALAHAIRALARVHAAIGAAERASGISANPRWPAQGLRADDNALLAVSNFDGTRYALHSDAAVNDERKIVAVYFPRSEPAWRPGDGGELRIECDGGEQRVSPRTDRLVLFHADLAHEVLPSLRGRPRISLSVWGLGVGTRRHAANQRVDLSHRCTSDLCARRGRLG